MPSLITSDTRSLLLIRKQALETERATWLPDYKEISRFVAPRMGRYTYTDTNKGNNRMNAIYDNTATRALRVCAAGLMAGMTSPARPWFRLGTPDPDLSDHGPVREWLDMVASTMRLIFNKSNTYRGLHMMYKEICGFGTTATIIKPHFENVIHFMPLTVGEYSIATDPDSRVTTLIRELQQTVSQLVREFGIDRVSPQVQHMFSTGKNLDAWVPCSQVIEPNYDRSIVRNDNQNMAFKSTYFELNGQHDYTLNNSGFKRLPGLIARWDVQGSDVYGQGAGHEALGDVKQLQQQQLDKGQAIDLMTRPPLQAPASLRNVGVNKLPGGVTYRETVGGTASDGITTLFDTTINIEHLREDIMDVRDRINKAFYVDLFLMIAQDERQQPATAREIAERHEEKLLMLGPVLERLHDEMLTPLIDITFDRMIETGIVPPAPPELQGKPLSVEFVSMLAQAQRAVGVNAVDRLIGTVGSIAAMQMQAQQPATSLDKLNIDEIVDEYNDMLGGDPKFMNDDKTVAAIRDGRAKQAAAAQAAANKPAAAQTAQTLSQTDTSGKNALTDMMSDPTSQFSGYSIPGATK